MTMIKSISILPDILINKIAAGEVVERPFSVVKELVENSIDAEADEISITLRDGGKTYIEIADNGKGMTEDDLLLSFERHATSKIQNYEDLVSIETMGFRGEALPSIASVSIVEAASRLKGSDEGSLVTIKGGVISGVQPIPLRQSTVIKVKSLFFNVPARRKFLKDAMKEYRYIYTYFKKLALSHPELNLKFIHNEKTIFDLRKEDLKNRIGSVLNEVNKDSLIEVSNSIGQYSLSGFIGKKELARKGKDNQYLFINGRIVEDKIISYTVFHTFRNMIEHGYYPFYILFIELPFSELDVNVHPAKLTVKFTDELRVKKLIQEGIGRVLRESLSIYDLGMNENEEVGSDVIPNTDDGTEFFDKTSNTYQTPKENDHVTSENIDKYTAKKERDFFRPETPGSKILNIQNEVIVSENIWQMHNKYIFIQVESGIMIIDQHVAHERILYEKAIKSFSKEKLPSQALLFPVNIELSFEDRLILKEITDYMNGLGFVLREFGGNSFIIEETPLGIEVGDEKREVLDLIDNFKLYRKKKMGVIESVAASYSCKRAIKTGQNLTPDEMITLINDLFQCEFPHVCPHGRPVVIDLSLKELDKRFMRI
ncbi:MAG: DNA mismatch repair endonuclease MutL [Candidatus Delongbacteria bacterium]|jgi:DNA mismatch repair protein MutL|nr:DNA mismatch repair endonuclease MutL [Candidatus Delongbacteria bacterium]